MGRIFLRIAAIAVLAVALVGCAPKSKFLTYDGPEVTRIVVMKADRRMYLMHADQVLESFDIDLGFAPAGHKQFEGDGRTPEGRYYIDRRNPNSTWHLSLGLSYPNTTDREHASTMGLSPGGDIFIHGQSRRGIDRRGRDWTAGCIAVTNREMELIYAMVRDRTPIDVFP